MTARSVDTDTQTVTIQVPWKLKRRGGRKIILAPDGMNIASTAASIIDNTTIKALVRAYRWQKLLETGAYSSIGELAAAEDTDPSYLGRMLRLTLLAPDIVNDILDNQLSEYPGMTKILKPVPADWKEQRRFLAQICL